MQNILCVLFSRQSLGRFWYDWWVLWSPVGGSVVRGSAEELSVVRWSSVGGGWCFTGRWFCNTPPANPIKRKLLEILREVSFWNRPIHILKFSTELYNLGISSVALLKSDSTTFHHRSTTEKVFSQQFQKLWWVYWTARTSRL